MMMVAGSDGRPMTVSGGVFNTNLAAGIRTGQFRFNSDGTSTIAGVGASGSIANWYSQTLAGVGSSYWIRYTLISSLTTTTSGMTSGTWYKLDTTPLLTINNSGVGTEATGSGTIDISGDGSTVLTTGTVTWDVGYTP